MSKFYLTIGFIGSGKSTWARKMAAVNPKVKVVCPDNIRRMLNGDYKYVKELDPIITEICCSAVHKLLRDGFDVIVDACNLSLNGGRRKRWIETAELVKDLHRKQIEIIAVIFPQKDKKWHIDNRMKDSHGNISREEWEWIYDLHIFQYEPIVENRFDDIIYI